MKIVHFFEYFSNGGIENVMANILSNLTIEGEKEILCTVKRNFGYDKQLQEKEVKWNVYTKRNLKNAAVRFFISCHVLKTYCKKNHPDLLHIHIYNPIGTYYARIANRYCKNVILHAHGTNYKNNLLKLKNIFSLMAFFIPKNVKLIACSRKSARFCFRSLKHTTILNNTIDLKRLRSGRPTYRAKYHLEDKWIITTIGRLESEKNILFLIDVFKDLKKKKENAFFLIVGSGSQKKKILNKVKRYHLEKDVLLLENVSDIKNIYASTDFYISFPLFEGFALTIIEAQACKIPTLVSSAIPKEEKISNFITMTNIKNVHNITSKILETANKCELKKYTLISYTPMKRYIKAIEDIYLQ